MKEPSDVLKRKIITYFVFEYLFIFLVYRLTVKITPSTLLGPPLKSLRFDFTYWIYQLLHIQDLIIYNPTGAVIFDFILLASCLLCIAFPLRNAYTLVFVIFFFVYVLSFNTYILHHAHSLAIPLLITIPFLFKKLEYWKILWEGMRFYICYVYTISFVWKVFIGKSFFFWNQGVNSIKQNQAEYMYFFPSSWSTSIYKFLIAYPIVPNMGHIIIILLEGIMVVGFFTKRFDKRLMFIPVIVHLVTYFVSDVFFIESIVGVLTFLSLKDINFLNNIILFLKNKIQASVSIIQFK